MHPEAEKTIQYWQISQHMMTYRLKCTKNEVNCTKNHEIRWHFI
jgi:hypothetical protein